MAYLRTKFRRGSAAHAILQTVAAAAVIGVAVSALAIAPGLAIIARGLMNTDNELDRSLRRRRQKQIHEAIKRLARRRLVRYEEREGETFIVVSKDGASELRKFTFEELRIPPVSQWDGKWRIVLFDIPEEFKRGREALRHKLREIGFYPLQRSVFVFPHECHDEVDFITNFCGVERYVEYATCDGLSTNEVTARKYFDLVLARS